MGEIKGWIEVILVVLYAALAFYLYVTYLEPKPEPDLQCEDLQGQAYFDCMEETEGGDTDNMLLNYYREQNAPKACRKAVGRFKVKSQGWCTERSGARPARSGSNARQAHDISPKSVSGRQL